MIVLSPLLDHLDFHAVQQVTPSGMIENLGIAGQDAKVGIRLGQGAAQESELAGTHPPSIGEELADESTVAAGIRATRNLENVPAQRTRRAGVKLADVYSSLQPGPVQRPPPALAKIEHHGAEMPLASGLVGQPLGRHALAEASIPAEGSVKVALAA